jgi:hypothetical protein
VVSRAFEDFVRVRGVSVALEFGAFRFRTGGLMFSFMSFEIAGFTCLDTMERWPRLKDLSRRMIVVDRVEVEL